MNEFLTVGIDEEVSGKNDESAEYLTGDGWINNPLNWQTNEPLTE